MEFCNFCNNMMYIKDDEDDKFNVKLYCKCCSYEKQISNENSSTLILQNTYDKKVDYKKHINPNIEYDITIPHVDNICCPNENCSKKESEKNDVMYIKIDHINLIYVYYCTYCKHFWKTN